MILLDTHVLVWLAARPDQLSLPARKALDSESELGISLASVQEVAYLAARGRLTMDRSVETWISDMLNVHEIRAIAPTISIARRAGGLDPAEFHGDPADRLIYATAVEQDARLVSADSRLRQCDPARVVW